MTDPIVPSVSTVLRDLVPAFLVGLIEDVLALVREMVDETSATVIPVP